MRSTTTRHLFFFVTALICRATPSIAQVAAVPAIPSEDGLYLVTRLVDRAEPGHVPVQTRTGAAWAAVGERIAARNVRVKSESSTNDRFSIWFSWSTSVANPRECSASGSLLRVDGVWRLLQSDGGSVPSCNYSNPAFADEPSGFAVRMAAVLGATPVLWMAVGQRVTGSYAPAKQVFQRGDTIEVLFTLRNPPDAPLVWRQVDGTFWRDWRVTITRDGKQLSTGSGGNGGYPTPARFGPGASTVTSIRLSNWTRDELGPGHYVVTIKHDVQLYAPDGDSYAPANSGGQHTYTGTVEFDVAASQKDVPRAMRSQSRNAP